MISRLSRFSFFWLRAPALYYGVWALCAALFYCTSSYLPLLPLIPLTLSSLFSEKGLWSPNRPLCALLLASTLYLHASIHYRLPALPDEGIVGVARFSIHSVGKVQTPFSTSLCYHGMVRTFSQGKEKKLVVKNAPVRLLFKNLAQTPPANGSYDIQGRLKQSRTGSYFFKPDPAYQWGRVPYSWSSAEMRYAMKQRVGRYIRSQLSDPRSSAFLVGLITGEFEDGELAFDFSRLGLTHIMAISGFHFSIIAGFLAFIFRFFLPPRSVALILSLLLSAYALFVGSAPSILRAWMVALIFLWGQLAERNNNPLNALGVALLILILWEPMIVTNIGFQFSFLITLSILLLTKPVERIVHMVLPRRSLSELVKMSTLQQHGYIASALLRKSTALTVAVHLSAIPTMLLLFHSFPLLGMVYNLFFPFLISISMALLLTGLLLSPLPLPIDSIIHGINNAYTKVVLDLTAPTGMVEYTLEVAALPLLPYVLYITTLLSYGAYASLSNQRCHS